MTLTAAGPTSGYRHVAELVELELDIAANADACGEDPQVRAEYEQQFLDEHATLLQQLAELRH